MHESTRSYFCYLVRLLEITSAVYQWEGKWGKPEGISLEYGHA